MSNQAVKFYKFSNSESSAARITTAKAVEGAIIYIVDARELWIGGSTPKLVIKGANDVTYESNILTVTHYDTAGVATTQTLDFSDVASAQATLQVFNSVYGLMGATASGTTRVLDYSSDQSGILHKTGQGETDPATLVAADLALAEAIGNAGKIDGVEINGINTVNGNKIAEIFVENAVYGEYDPTNNKLATVNSIVGRIQALDVTEYAQASIETDSIDIKSIKEVDGVISAGDTAFSIPTDGTVSSSNKLATESTVNDSFADKSATNVQGVDYTAADTTNGAKLTFKGISETNGVIGQGTGTTELQFAKVATSGDAEDVAYDGTTSGLAAANVQAAIDELAGDISNAVTDVKIDNTTIVSNNVASISTDTNHPYDASTNPLATVNTVSGAIEALDGSATIATYNSTSGIVTLKAGITETDGVVSNNSDGDIELAKVAKSGAAEDVSITDAGGYTTETTVEGALQEIYENIAAMAGGMRYNGDISTATATLNTSTNDIRPGDIYLASGAFTIGSNPETSVEAGDMIVYKGAESTSTVTLDNSNCTIIERETDTMVTAGNTLADDYVVFGNGNKEVTTTSNDSFTLTATQLNAAVGAANSALQSIAKGTDGTYVNTTVGAKDANNQQTVSVEVTQSTVTYTAASGSDPATLTATNGLLDESAITPIKNYIDGKVGTAVQSVTEAADVTDTYVVVNSVVGGTATDPTIHVETTVTYGSSSISGDTITVTDGVAKMSDVDTLIGQEISLLDADITSDDAAVATVEVVETDGKITDVVVTNISAGVVYNTTTGTLTANTTTGAVTGADIATIKDYVDAQATQVTNLNATLGVNDDTTHTLATVGGTDITAQVTLNWEEYE